MDLISELKRKQQKEPLIYESDRDGAIEDIITGEGLASGLCPSPVPYHVILFLYPHLSLRGLLPPTPCSRAVRLWLSCVELAV